LSCENKLVVNNPREFMTEQPAFQSIIMTLEKFWADQGCLIWQPHHTEVGAGTMNPATALRVLGPEPWNVGYVEPSIRPDDGRYGENPNRFYQHIQYQVILKPDPGDPQRLYLESLMAMGIDPRKHDIRFVEDNWESPIIGAWGLGWEVWLDGLEITQFTYFQQSGGHTLDPVSVELTYGLERIAMALQGVRDFRDIRWNDTLTYGDVLLQSEQEYSKYSFELADVGRLRQMFEMYETEAEICLANQQVLPAHDYVLKCSHTFNVLDTRGAVGVTERQTFFRRMRELSRRVADAYIEQRQRLEFPMSTETSIQPVETTFEKRFPDTASPFLLEIGTEEMPPADLESALELLRESAPKLMQKLRLEYTDIHILGTPRRLVLYVEDLAHRQSDFEQMVKGPPADRAYDADGEATKAAQGFARSKGVRVDDLEIREADGGQYVFAPVHEPGRPAYEALSGVLPDLIANLRFDKTMRWNQSNVAFSRPIRWLLALHGEQVIPFEYANLKIKKSTRGLRFPSQENLPEELPIPSPVEYFAALRAQGIILDPNERKSSIKTQIKALADEVRGEVAHDPDLLTETSHLVEAPTAVRGDFNPRHLKLPREVLVSVMKKHQRYFPIERDGKLLPHFITIINKAGQGLEPSQAFEEIVSGNEDVIRARFEDAAYFVRKDQERKLEQYLPKLELLTFQEDLGSMLDKTHRIEGLVDYLTPIVGLTPEEATTTRRAALLCKADLATQMVVDMTSLQGTMGRYYALHSGETEAVAQAIYEHYLPRHAGDHSPQTCSGFVVGMADRLDSLVGLFAAGLAPTGAKDPFAQRRAALGLVSNLITWGLDLDLRPVIKAAATQLPIQAPSKSQDACLEFIVERLRNQLLDEGYEFDVVDAVLSAQGHNPAKTVMAVKELSQWTARDDWNEILPAYARCVRITRDEQKRLTFDFTKTSEPAEKQLFKALDEAEATRRRPGSVDDFLDAFLPMIPAINQFFDHVLVMAEDESLRRNRLALLQRIVALADSVADMSKLQGF
jgi:glycyl-tRNA synthetase